MKITIAQLSDGNLKIGVVVSAVLKRSINSTEKETIERFISDYIRERLLLGKAYKLFLDKEFNSVSVCAIADINSFPQSEDTINVGFDI